MSTVTVPLRVVELAGVGVPPAGLEKVQAMPVLPDGLDPPVMVAA